MLIGIVLAWRLIRAARPIEKSPIGESWTAGCDVRISDAVSIPVTFSSTILIPADYINWDAAKRHAVLCHEKSHVERRDFVILLLASLHCAIFWFNPLSWWLKRRIAELAEIISDDAAVAALGDRHSYAGILLDVAGTARPIAAGVAMARPQTVRKRIERLLTEAAPAASVTPRRRLLLVLPLLPVAVVAAIDVARGAPPAGIAAEAQVAPGERAALPAPPRVGRTDGLVPEAIPLWGRMGPDQQAPPDCKAFVARPRDAGRHRALAAARRIEQYRPFGFANDVTKVTYDWPGGVAQTGLLSCFTSELVL